MNCLLKQNFTIDAVQYIQITYAINVINKKQIHIPSSVITKRHKLLIQYKKSYKKKKYTKYDKHIKTSDPVKDCYLQIVNKFIENHIKYTYNLHRAFAIDYSVGRVLVD